MNAYSRVPLLRRRICRRRPQLNFEKRWPTPARAAISYTVSAARFVSDSPSRKPKARCRLPLFNVDCRFMQFFTLYSPTRDAELYACSFPTRRARIMLLGRLSMTVVGGQDAPGHFTVGYSSRLIQNVLRLLSRVACSDSGLMELVYRDRLAQWSVEAANAKRYTRRLSTRDATLIRRQFDGDETLKP